MQRHRDPIVDIHCAMSLHVGFIDVVHLQIPTKLNRPQAMHSTCAGPSGAPCLFRVFWCYHYQVRARGGGGEWGLTRPERF